MNTSDQQKFIQNKESFPELECPCCNKLTKPFKVNSDGSVRYVCTNKNNHEFSSWSYLQNCKFTIMEDGSLKE